MFFKKYAFSIIFLHVFFIFSQCLIKTNLYQLGRTFLIFKKNKLLWNFNKMMNKENKPILIP